MTGWTTAARAVGRLAGPHETKVRFLAAGGLNTAFGLAIFPVLMWTFGPRGLHYMIGLLISQMLSISLAYLTNKFLVFRTTGNYLREFGKFASFYISYFLVNVIVLPFSVEVLHARPIIAQTIFSVAVILTSWFWHSRITFRSRTPSP